MFILKLNHLASFKSKWCFYNKTHIDYETYKTTDPHPGGEGYLGGGLQKRPHSQISSPLPRAVAEILRQVQRANRRNLGLFTRVGVQLAERLHKRGHIGAADQERATQKASAHQRKRRRNRPQGSEREPIEHEGSESCLGGGERAKCLALNAETFFRSIGARYKRIRRSPKGIPSPHLYESIVERLQELERLYKAGIIDLFYADETHVCTHGYVPYGWQFQDEKVFVPSQKAARLNIFGMTSRDNVYHGFTIRENIDSAKFVGFMDEFSKTLENPP